MPFASRMVGLQGLCGRSKVRVVFGSTFSCSESARMNFIRKQPFEEVHSSQSLSAHRLILIHALMPLVCPLQPAVSALQSLCGFVGSGLGGLTIG